MPVTWSPAPEKILGDALTQAWVALNKIVEDQPSFEEVTGASVARLREQAVEAVTTMKTFKSEWSLNDEAAMSYVYILGFTVGTIYGANNHETDRTQAR